MTQGCFQKELYLDLVRSKAVAEYHHGTNHNGYIKGSDEYFAYEEKIEWLKTIKKEREQ